MLKTKTKKNVIDPLTAIDRFSQLLSQSYEAVTKKTHSSKGVAEARENWTRDLHTKRENVLRNNKAWRRSCRERLEKGSCESKGGQGFAQVDCAWDPGSFWRRKKPVCRPTSAQEDAWKKAAKRLEALPRTHAMTEEQFVLLPFDGYTVDIVAGLEEKGIHVDKSVLEGLDARPADEQAYNFYITLRMWFLAQDTDVTPDRQSMQKVTVLINALYHRDDLPFGEKIFLAGYTFDQMVRAAGGTRRTARTPRRQPKGVLQSASALARFAVMATLMLAPKAVNAQNLNDQRVVGNANVFETYERTSHQSAMRYIEERKDFEEPDKQASPYPDQIDVMKVARLNVSLNRTANGLRKVSTLLDQMVHTSATWPVGTTPQARQIIANLKGTIDHLTNWMEFFSGVGLALEVSLTGETWEQRIQPRSSMLFFGFAKFFKGKSPFAWMAMVDYLFGAFAWHDDDKITWGQVSMPFRFLPPEVLEGHMPAMLMFATMLEYHNAVVEGNATPDLKMLYQMASGRVAGTTVYSDGTTTKLRSYLPRDERNSESEINQARFVVIEDFFNGYIRANELATIKGNFTRMQGENLKMTVELARLQAIIDAMKQEETWYDFVSNLFDISGAVQGFTRYLAVSGVTGVVSIVALLRFFFGGSNRNGGNGGDNSQTRQELANLTREVHRLRAHAASVQDIETKLKGLGENTNNVDEYKANIRLAFPKFLEVDRVTAYKDINRGLQKHIKEKLRLDTEYPGWYFFPRGSKKY
jgi:hypothetical protein